jgi:type II secretory pathway component PulF
MNTPPSNTNIERWWATYLKAAAFLVPAVSLWMFSVVFLFPKLKTIWRDAGFYSASARFVMATADFITDHGLLIGAAILIVLGLLEWRSSRWPRYRRGFVGVAVFLLNSAVLIGITAMFATALIAAPALFHTK